MGKTDGRKWVDLGLPSGRKWAMCNIGAEDDEDDYLGMEEYGSYFAWGDVKGDPYAGSKQSGYRRSFDWGNYSLCNGSQDTINKYCSVDGQGVIIDNKMILDTEDDPATVLWGSSWKTPSYEDFLELKKECEWSFEKIYSVNGALVKGKNGQCIFLPAAGFRLDDGLWYDGFDGNYWTSSLYKEAAHVAWNCYINFRQKEVELACNFRRLGLSIRPVLK